MKNTITKEELFAKLKSEYYESKYTDNNINQYNNFATYVKAQNVPNLTVRDDGSFEYKTENAKVTGQINKNSMKIDEVRLGEGTTNECIITYNANGGENAPVDNNKYIRGTEVTLSTDEPTYAGHTFLGWAESATASESDTITSCVLSESKEFYAVWLEGYKTYTKEAEMSFKGYNFYIIGGETAESEKLILLLKTKYGSTANWSTAKSRAVSFGSALGVTGRLMTVSEANGISSGKRNIGENYWLLDHDSSNNGAVVTYAGGCTYFTDVVPIAVRPVIEVPKSQI